MNLDLWKEKTKGLFHIVEWTKFWNYINNLIKENDILTNDIKVLLKENESKEEVIIRLSRLLKESENNE